MPKPRTNQGGKNIVASRLIALRHMNKMSQRMLAYQLQLLGYDIDRNVITRIENNTRYVADFEVEAFARVFQIPCGYFYGEADLETQEAD